MRNTLIPPSNRGDLLVNDYRERGLSPLTPQDMDVTTGRGILVHNKLYLHNYRIEGFGIMAPNLKQARKIHKRMIAAAMCSDFTRTIQASYYKLYEGETVGTFIPSPPRKQYPYGKNK